MWNRSYLLNPLLTGAGRRKGKSPGLGSHSQGSSTTARLLQAGWQLLEVRRACLLQAVEATAEVIAWRGANTV